MIVPWVDMLVIVVLSLAVMRLVFKLRLVIGAIETLTEPDHAELKTASYSE
jgi:hypothetical protein